jgi:ribulose-phosphate 3-epimerase
MITISPSILAADFLNLEKEIKRFDSFQDIWFHLDIMDGHFVPNLTFGHPIRKKISISTSHKLDAHLMVINPEFYLDTLKGMNIHNITFHMESCTDPLALIKKGKENFPSVGISIRPKTSTDLLTDDILSSIDLLLIMSVEPGFGGQKFIDDTFSRITKIKSRKDQLKLNFIIQIDGGVSDKNALQLINHGANNLVAGTYLFNSPPSEDLKKIKLLRCEK